MSEGEPVAAPAAAEAADAAPHPMVHRTLSKLIVPEHPMVHRSLSKLSPGLSAGSLSSYGSSRGAARALSEERHASTRVEGGRSDV